MIAKTPPVRRSKIVNLNSEAGDRVVEARFRCENVMHELCKDAGLGYPVEEIFLRVFKQEGELEVWGRAPSERAVWGPGPSQPFQLIATYAVLQPSGLPGPKRREGDLQVPEGFYEIDLFNPKSSFHLSLGLNYPNAADRILSDPAHPGFDIFIHGGAVSVGCLPLGDDRVEEVYLMALDSKVSPIKVHIFPARMSGPDWPAWRDEQVRKTPALETFWQQLQPGYDAFEQTHQLPQITVRPDGRYECKGER